MHGFGTAMTRNFETRKGKKEKRKINASSTFNIEFQIKPKFH